MPKETLEDKLIGREGLDAAYCDFCGIDNGIYLLKLTADEMICPRCGRPIEKPIVVTLHKWQKNKNFFIEEDED